MNGEPGPFFPDDFMRRIGRPVSARAVQAGRAKVMLSGAACCNAMPCHAVSCCALLCSAVPGLPGDGCASNRLGPSSSLAWHPARTTSIARIRSTLTTLIVLPPTPNCLVVPVDDRDAWDLVHQLVGYALQVWKESIGRSLGNVTVAANLALACMQCAH